MYRARRVVIPSVSKLLTQASVLPFVFVWGADGAQNYQMVVWNIVERLDPRSIHAETTVVFRAAARAERQAQKLDRKYRPIRHKMRCVGSSSIV